MEPYRLDDIMESYILSEFVPEIVDVKETPLGGIHIVMFDNCNDMSLTCMRFSEHYESSKWRKEVFSFGEYIDHYVKRHGVFDYHLKWGGHNFPANNLRKFRDGSFGTLSKAEELFLGVTSHISDEDYICIVALDTSIGHIKHEIAHGLFYTNKDYRAEMIALMEGVNIGPMIDMLYSNYHWAVFMDEAHAYLATCYKQLSGDGLNISKLKPISVSMSDVFSFYAKPMEKALRAIVRM